MGQEGKVVATYEYVCRNCDNTMTVARPITDPDPGYFCGTCGHQMNKSYSIGTIKFNGSGFYSKDK
jgi:putative FmdB family regulatory protein